MSKSKRKHLRRGSQAKLLIPDFVLQIDFIFDFPLSSSCKNLQCSPAPPKDTYTHVKSIVNAYHPREGGSTDRKHCPLRRPSRLLFPLSWLLGLVPGAGLRPKPFRFSSHSPPCTCLKMKVGPSDVYVRSALELTALLICIFHQPP